MVYRHASEYFPDTILQWIDVVLLILFFLVCTGQRGFAFPDIASIQLWEGGILVLLISLWKSIFSFMHMEHSLTLYQEAWKDIITRNCVAVTLGWGITIVSIYLINLTMLLFDLSKKGRSLFYFDTIQSTFVWLGVLLLLFLPYRIVIALLLRQKDIKQPLSHALIVGGLNIRSHTLAENLRRKDSGYKLLGFADNLAEEDAQHAEALNVVCSLQEVADYIRTHSVDEIFLTLPVRSFYDEIKSIIQYSVDMGLTVRVLNDLFTFEKGKFQYSEYIEGDLSYFTADSTLPSAEEEVQVSTTFLVEKIIAFCALVFFTPLFLVAWGLNFFHWPFALKVYIGLNKKPFSMVQFKEMRGANTFLQKRGIRDIPRLMNIVLGDMSIIGPQPVPQHMQKTYAYYKDNKMLDQRRFMVKPGLISPRSILKEGAVSLEEYIQVELDYIACRGFLTDCKILIKFLKKRLIRLVGYGSN
uniref:sugar transferase n=1 Tax=Candidatus Electrothrix sp. TaxID=2170559 RepID=UPI004057842F